MGVSVKKLIFIFSVLLVTNLFPVDFDIHSLKTSVQTNLQNIKKNGINLSNNHKIVLKTTVALTAAYYAYSYGKIAYIYISNKIAEKNEKELIRLIELQFKLNPQCNDQELKDKAWSVNIRKRVLEQLEKIDCNDSRWSQNFQDEFTKLEKNFKTFDKVRNGINTCTVGILANNREEEFDKPYEELSYLDQYMINMVVDNTLLKYKPDNECTLSEIAQKKEMKESSKRINKALKNDLGKFAASKAISLAAGAFLTFII